MDEYEDSREEFQWIYNDSNVPEAYYSTPEVLEDMYLNMEVSLPCDGEVPKYAKVKSAYVIPMKFQFGPPWY